MTLNVWIRGHWCTIIIISVQRLSNRRGWVVGLRSPTYTRHCIYTFFFSTTGNSWNLFWSQFKQLRIEKVRTSTGFKPVTSRYRWEALTNWAMKPLTLGAGYLWVLMSPWRMIWIWNFKSAVQYMKHFIYHFTDKTLQNDLTDKDILPLAKVVGLLKWKTPVPVRSLKLSLVWRG